VYEPLNVYKSVAAGIGIVDGPLEYFIVAGMRLPLPFTTRMTVVQLRSGDLFLHSPIAFDPVLARISHTKKCIGAPNQRKFFCDKDFPQIRGRPDDDRL